MYVSDLANLGRQVHSQLVFLGRLFTAKEAIDVKVIGKERAGFYVGASAVDENRLEEHGQRLRVPLIKRDEVEYRGLDIIFYFERAERVFELKGTFKIDLVLELEEFHLVDLAHGHSYLLR